MTVYRAVANFNGWRAGQRSDLDEEQEREWQPWIDRQWLIREPEPSPPTERPA